MFKLCNMKNNNQGLTKCDNIIFQLIPLKITEISIASHSHEYSQKISYPTGLPWYYGNYHIFSLYSQYGRWTTECHLVTKHIHPVPNQGMHPAINNLLTATSICQYWCANRPKLCCFSYFFTFTSPTIPSIAECKQHNISFEASIKNSYQWFHLHWKCLPHVGILPPTCYHGYEKPFYLPQYFL